MFHPSQGSVLMMLLSISISIIITTATAVHNNATESGTLHLHLHPSTHTQPTQEESNQARNGGRTSSDAVRTGLEQSQVGCRELRSTKYISDGQCTSINPIKELVCAGECLPNHLLPNWIGAAAYSGKYWSRRDSQEWRCIIDRTTTQRIRLQCHDGSTRTYKITVVQSCKCKRYTRQLNNSGQKDTAAHRGKLRRNQDKANPEELPETQSNN
ncbi:sclerostin domain-containing protein 1-like [Gouania willdenowi]|uniref:Sclerostin domain-containing protein 1-like n=1 Tax=Gouania willdenowi TaxID=441366 RepID=A0A8C5DLH2_GOUWI|nr:sclerostin domain-containing protein 1-like [Gouania willdenowi]